MTQVQGIPYRRHGPTAALREFLDPLDPGDYFDCGRARLHGLDDALLEEARSRGRDVGDDAFLLVATDMGLIFCRPSISFAIAARWQDIGLIRPRGDDPVVLPVTWPRHGELKFTISKRLAGNIFRRWLQLRMNAARRARQAEHHPVGIGSGLGFDAASDAGGEEAATSPDAEGSWLVTRSENEEPVGGTNLATAAEEPADDGSERRAEAGRIALVDHESDRLRIDDIAGLEGLDGLDDLEDADGPDGPESIDTVEPPTSLPAETGDDLPLFGPLAARSGAGTLADEDLERVVPPRTTTAPPSWVGSAVSVAASLVVVSTVVLIASVSVSLWRGASGPSSPTSGQELAGPTQTTIDHERFRSSSDPVGQLGPGATNETTGLAPSAAGGASQALPSSRQQLLAVPPDAADPDQAIRCSSNYSGCVPDVVGTAGADVDCVGQGDGPYFAEAEVMVLGDDIYGLDSDGDRIACEADQHPTESLTADPAGLQDQGG